MPQFLPDETSKWSKIASWRRQTHNLQGTLILRSSCFCMYASVCHVHLSGPSLMSVRHVRLSRPSCCLSIRHICLSCLSITFVCQGRQVVCHVRPSHLSITSVCHDFLSCLSVTSVCHVCPSCLLSCLSVMSVHHICPSRLSFK